MTAWSDLRTCRQLTEFGPGPLPWSSVDRWAERNGVTGQDFDFLWAMLTELDAEFTDYWVKKNRNGDGA